MVNGEASMGQDWWRGAVIYQVYPRSFMDSNADGIGDLQGITARLPYLAALGVDAVWLSPVFKSPMADMGYDVSDYTDIDPSFGTLADFDALVARAHDLGLKVMIDQVLSHSSIEHPWFAQSRLSRDNPKADWYVWADPKPDGTPPNNWLSVFGGSAWSWDARRHQYYLHNFLDLQPDLNFHNPEVQDALLDVLRFWCERGVDGFRLDTVNYFTHDALLRSNPPKRHKTLQSNPYEMQRHVYSKSRPENIGFLQRVRALMDEYPDRTLVGEVGDSDIALKLMGEYTSGGDKLHMAYSFDMLSPEFSPAHFKRVINGFWQGASGGWPMWSMSNHDVIRHVTRWEAMGAPEAVAKLSIVLLASLEGTLCLYQGEELGLGETELRYDELTDPVGLRFWPENKGRDGCRTPMVWDESQYAGFSTAKPWLPVKPPQALRAASLQGEGSVLAHYRAVLAWRKGSEILRAGGTAFLKTKDPVLGFVRHLGEERLTFYFNLSAQPVEIKADGEITGPLCGAEIRRGKLVLPATGWAILRG